MSDLNNEDSVTREKGSAGEEETGGTVQDDSAETSSSLHHTLPHNNIVDFDKPFDQADPLQWPQGKKLAVVINIALLSAAGQMASSMIAPSAEQIITEFHTASLLLATLVVSAFMLGTAAGLLLTAGVSEVYGRCAVIHATNVLFVVFGAAAAVSGSLGQLVGFRVLQGVVAAAPPAVGGGVIGDMFEPRERGRATAVYGFGMLMGPMVGPVVGGYVTQRLGWRWVCWVVTISVGVRLVLLVSGISCLTRFSREQSFWSQRSLFSRNHIGLSCWSER